MSALQQPIPLESRHRGHAFHGTSEAMLFSGQPSSLRRQKYSSKMVPPGHQMDARLLSPGRTSLSQVPEAAVGRVGVEPGPLDSSSAHTLSVSTGNFTSKSTGTQHFG